MKYLSVPAMFTNEYLEKLNQMNKENKRGVKIYETYGSIPGYLVGSIRPSNTLKSITKEELFSYIKKGKELGIGFNYIMNSTVLDGFEYNKELKMEVINFIKELVSVGLSKITISVPYLIKLVRKYFPNLHIVASICMEISSLQGLEDVRELGVNSVVMAKDTNRDFKLLRNILKNKGELSIKLLCTTPCIFKCSDLIYHMNFSSIQDNKLKNSYQITGKVIPHTAVRCQMRRLKNPVEFIKSPWIRPEDLDYYNKIGIEYFKIDGRDKTEDYNLEVINAYMNEEYDGNLLYLMQNYYPKNSLEFLTIDKLPNFKLGVFLDNKLLNNFINYFYDEGNPCNEGCQNCNYCENWKEKAIQIKDENIEKYMKVLLKEEEERFDI